MSTAGALIAGLVEDLRQEQDALAALLADRAESDWVEPTPAKGWDVRDQIAHLAHFDAIARMCIADPGAFIALRDGLADLQEYVDGIGEVHRHRPGSEMLAWWREENEALRNTALAADPKAQVPWFGPAMSLASKLTARIMETWAHGQDVTDALGLTRPATDRLRHIARLGVLALPYSFRNRGMDVPRTPIHVALTPPAGGEPWTWGDPEATERVTGSALEFCLVVTQRRHVADTGLDITGPVARSWMQIAQAFAGPPGRGRDPGQFSLERE